MRSLHATALESLQATDLAVSYALILDGSYGYATRRSANGYNMPRLQELTVEGVRVQGDSLAGLPDLVEDADIAAETITVTIAPPRGTPDSAFVARHRASPTDSAATAAVSASLYLLLGDATTHATADGTALLLWTGRVASHEFSGDGERLTLTLSPLWADLAQAPLLRYDPQDQRRLHSGDTGLDHTPATRRRLALSSATSSPAAEADASLLLAPYRRLVYGRQLVQGDVLLMATTGASSRYLNLIVAFAAHEVAALERLWLDDREVEFSTGDTVTGYFATSLTVSRKLGTTSQAADSSLTTQLGTTLWPSTSQLKGIAYVALRLLWDPDTWGDGLPVVTALVKGKLCLDPRDTGAAAAWSANPAVQLFDYLRDSTHGPGLAETSLDVAAFATAASACDEAVELATGLTEPRYTSHLTATHEATREQIITALAASMAGTLITSGSTLSLRAGIPAASELSLDASGLVGWWRENSLEAPALRNTASGTYVSVPNYVPIGYPPVELADWVAVEGARPQTLDFPGVVSPTQAQRLAKLWLLRNRRRLRATASLPLSGYRLQVGDVVTVAIPGQSIFQSLAPVEMEIAQITLALSGVAPVITYALRETGASDYAWATTDEGTTLAPATLPADLAAWRLARLAPPALNKPSQTFGTAGSGSITVDVATVGEPGATVRFTTDGTDPTTSSTAWGASPRTFTATTTVKILAHLAPLVSEIVTYTYTLVAAALIDVNVTIDPTGSGSVTGDGTKTEGSTVTLSATGSGSNGFIKWLGTSTPYANPLVFLAGTSDINLTAKFGPRLATPVQGGYSARTEGLAGPNRIIRITYSIRNNTSYPVVWSYNAGQTWVGALQPGQWGYHEFTAQGSFPGATLDLIFRDPTDTRAISAPLTVTVPTIS